jgi:hypothetical protein
MPGCRYARTTPVRPAPNRLPVGSLRHRLLIPTNDPAAAIAMKNASSSSSGSCKILSSNSVSVGLANGSVDGASSIMAQRKSRNFRFHSGSYSYN